MHAPVPTVPAPRYPRQRSSLGRPGPCAADVLTHTIIAALVGFTLGRTAACLTYPAFHVGTSSGHPAVSTTP